MPLGVMWVGAALVGALLATGLDNRLMEHLGFHIQTTQVVQIRMASPKGDKLPLEPLDSIRAVLVDEDHRIICGFPTSEEAADDKGEDEDVEIYVPSDADFRTAMQKYAEQRAAGAWVISPGCVTTE